MRTQKTIEELNADATLEDTQVIWAGEAVMLYPKPMNAADIRPGSLLASFSSRSNVVEKITRWCNKNSYRCTQVHDGRVWL